MDISIQSNSPVENPVQVQSEVSSHSEACPTVNTVHNSEEEHDIDTMAPQQQKEEEIKMRMFGLERRYQLHAHGERPNPRNVANALREMEDLLFELDPLVITRISKITVAANKVEALDAWYTERERIQTFLYDGKTHHKTMQGADQEAVTEHQLEVNANKAKRDSALKQVATEIALLKADFDENWTNPQDMMRQQYLEYSNQILEIKKMIWPTLDKLNDELCKVDRANAGSHHEDFAKELKTVVISFREVQGIFNAMKFSEEVLNSTLGASGSGLAAPQRNSTEINSSLLSLGTAGDFNNSKGYRDYKNGDPPSFHGDPAAYPLFKREWQTAVQRGRDDAWIIRKLAHHVKCPDKSIAESIKLCKTAKDAWDLLDRIFANPTIVSSRVVTEFMNIKKANLKPFTPQSQLATLQLRVKQLIQQLEAVQQGAQFKQNAHLITFAINLLPEIYHDAFSEKRQTKERDAKAAGNEFGPSELFTLFTDYMEDKVLQFREFQPDTLMPPKSTGGKKDTSQRNSYGAREIPDNSASDTSTSEEEEQEEEERIPRKEKKRFTSNSQSRSGGPPSGGSNGNNKNKNPDWGTMVQVKKDWKKMGKCPVCDEDGHFWKGERGVFASTQLTDCPAFRRASLDERIAFYKKLKLCRRCTSRDHQIKDCSKSKEKLFCRKNKADGTPCKADHATLFHGGQFKGNHIRLKQISEESPYPDDVMLAIVSLQVNNKFRAVALLDNGSNSTLVTHDFAAELGLKGNVTSQEVELCGRKPEIQQVTYYNIKLSTDEGEVQVRLLGVDKITSNPGSYDVSVAYDLFPHIKRPVLDKPDGNVSLLIGADQIRFMPGGGLGRNQKGNLRVFDICIPPYKCLMGSHPKISFMNPTLTNSAAQWRAASVRNLMVSRLPGPICLNSINVPADFWEAETLGYDVPRKCNRCRNCQVCHIVEEGMTVKGQLELQAMREGITYNPVEKNFTVKFPIVGDITKFKDNRRQAEVRAEALEKSLIKRKLLDAYNEQVADFVKRGVWKEVSRADIKAYQDAGGYTHHVGHHAVLSPQSKSTPLRVVVDSALRNNYTGPKLSSLYAKGPNCLKSLYSVLNTWRSYQHVGVFDVSKCYHGMKTGVSEFYMRLVLWRKPGEQEFTTYGHCTVGFGDISASTLLELIFAKLAEMGRDIDPHTALQLEILRYVDDGLFGGTKEQISSMRGNVTWTDDKPVYDGYISQILALGGFKVKHICLSGETDQKILERQGAVLGMEWDPVTDRFICKIKVNLSKKVGAGRKHPDLEVKDIPSIAKVVFTRRLALQVASQIWDPLGLLTPYTIRLKILMKELVDHEKLWDEPLADVFQAKWRSLVVDMIKTEPIYFPRSLTVESAVGRPEIIAFFDGSDQAFGAVLYIRFRTADPDKFITNLITSKGRVTPKGGTTTPRSELSGLVVAVRLCSKVVRALSHTARPIRVTVAGDSKCSVTAVDTNCAALNPFFANRALEVIEAQKEWGTKYEHPATQELSDLEIANLGDEATVYDKVQYLPGEQNPADHPSRGNLKWEQLQEGWQVGPPFISTRRESWPFSVDFLPTLPAEERRKRFVEVSVLNNIVANLASHSTKVSQGAITSVRMFEAVNRVMAKYTDLTRATAVIARVYRASRMGDRGEIKNLDNSDLAAGLFLMQFAAQRDHMEEITAKKTWESLSIFMREGLARARGRMGQRPIKHLIGHQDLIVLSPKSSLAMLVMIAAHREDHRLGPGDAVFRSVKRGYWILQGRRLAEKVIKSCMHCRRLRTETVQQKMGNLPPLINKVPVRPFSHIALDYGGVMSVRSEVNKRNTMRCYPLLMICLNTSSIHTQLCAGYDTESFLTSLQHFFAIRGRSSFIYTDMGNQITSASNKLDLQDKGNMMEKDPGDQGRPIFNFKKVKAATASHGVEWHHCPVQSQWRDGRSEAAVKSLKRSLRHLNPGNDLTYAELSCLLARAANQVNERPLGIRHHQMGSPDVCVITPNLLLQGSRTCAAQTHSEDFDTYMSRLTLRLGYIEQCYQDWWNLWLTSVWPSLVPFRRWKVEHRNVTVGDIVMVRHQGKVAKPTFRLARVLKAFPDEEGNVRSVVVGYRPRHAADRRKMKYVAKPLEELTASVQRLVVLLAVEEQHLLPPPSPHKHACPRHLKVPASAAETAEDDEMISPPTAPSVPQNPKTEVSQEASRGETEPATRVEDIISLQANLYKQRRPFYCWQCCHRVLLREEKATLAPSPQ